MNNEEKNKLIIIIVSVLLALTITSLMILFDLLSIIIGLIIITIIIKVFFKLKKTRKNTKYLLYGIILFYGVYLTNQIILLPITFVNNGLNLLYFLSPIILATLFPSAVNLFNFPVNIEIDLKKAIKIKEKKILGIAIALGIIFGIMFLLLKEPILFQSKDIIILIAFILAVAIAEETWFRYFLQGIAKKSLNLNKAIILQAIIFAIMHLSKTIKIELFIVLLVFGLTIGWIKSKSNLSTVIIMHFISNLVLLIGVMI